MFLLGDLFLSYHNEETMLFNFRGLTLSCHNKETILFTIKRSLRKNPGSGSEVEGLKAPGFSGFGIKVWGFSSPGHDISVGWGMQELAVS